MPAIERSVWRERRAHSEIWAEVLSIALLCVHFMRFGLQIISFKCCTHSWARAMNGTQRHKQWQRFFFEFLCHIFKYFRIKIHIQTVKFAWIRSLSVCQWHWLRLYFVLLLSLEQLTLCVFSPNNNAIALIISSVSKRISIKVLAQTQSLHMFNTCSCFFISNWDKKKRSTLTISCFWMLFILFDLLILWNFTEIQWRFAMLSCHLINWLKPSA